MQFLNPTHQIIMFQVEWRMSSLDLLYMVCCVLRYVDVILDLNFLNILFAQQFYNQ